MAHDDTIDALAYAVKYATPPKNLIKEKDGSFQRKVHQPKNWVLA